MSWLADANNRLCLRRALSAHLPAFLRAIAAHGGDLQDLARAIWQHDVGSEHHFGVAAGALSFDQIRYVLEDYLRDAYRARADRTDLCFALRELTRPAIVFSDEHGTCLLVQNSPRTFPPRVVGSGFPIYVANPHMLVLAPSHTWLELDAVRVEACA